MENKNKDDLYIGFLEVVSTVFDPESLLHDSFKIICKTFNAQRIQIWEKTENKNEFSVFKEYLEGEKGKKDSMLKYRVSDLPENLLESSNITNDILNKFHIYSLIGHNFKLPDKHEGGLFLAFEEKNKKLNINEITLFGKMTKKLEVAFNKACEYKESSEELKRLQTHNARLREQDYQKLDFINNITHELKTPLASILGFSKILTTKNPDKETTKEIAGQINQASNRLSGLISDFLQINKLNSNNWSPSIEICDIGELIKYSVEEFSALNKNHKISHVISDNYPTVKTDPKLVRQVLDNLISNAIKYSPDDSNICVYLEISNKKNDLIVSVSDNGIGITKDEMLNIFTRFYRSNNEKVRSVPGSGLGLSICKDIISALKGKISVESELNKGSKFSFTLPIN